MRQILNGSRPVPLALIRRWGARLQFDPEEIAAYVAGSHANAAEPDVQRSRLREWSTEAEAIMDGPIHFEIVSLSREPGQMMDSRAIADRTGASVDAVNIALSRLLRLGLVEAPPSGCLQETTGLAELNEHAFRVEALKRVRLRIGGESAVSAIRSGAVDPIDEEEGGI